jgi:hypothetical protein
VDLSQPSALVVDYPPTLTSAGIIGFAHSNIELLSFAVFFTRALFPTSSPTGVREICDGINKLNEIRHFSYLKCQRTSAPHHARVVGASSSLVMFVPTNSYNQYNFILQDMLHFTVVDDYMEETDEDVDEEEEEEEEDEKEEERVDNLLLNC